MSETALVEKIVNEILPNSHIKRLPKGWEVCFTDEKGLKLLKIVPLFKNVLDSEGKTKQIPQKVILTVGDQDLGLVKYFKNVEQLLEAVKSWHSDVSFKRQQYFLLSKVGQFEKSAEVSEFSSALFVETELLPGETVLHAETRILKQIEEAAIPSPSPSVPVSPKFYYEIARPQPVDSGMAFSLFANKGARGSESRNLSLVGPLPDIRPCLPEEDFDFVQVWKDGTIMHGFHKSDLLVLDTAL